MPTIRSVHFGDLDYGPESVILFPLGIPAFETERRFIHLRAPQREPLISLQSASTPSLAFLALAVKDIVLQYEVELSDEDVDALGGVCSPEEVEVLALIAVSEGDQVTANLQAPVVIHPQRRLAVQSIQSNPAYSCSHPIGVTHALDQEPPCS